jgi:hypothetical protein
MGEEYQMTIWEAPKSEECEGVGETNLQPPLPYPDDIKKEETFIGPKNESITEIATPSEMYDVKDSIDTIQSVSSPAIVQIPNEIQNETMQKQVVPKEYAYVISELWKTIDRRGGMEFRHVHNRLKSITKDDMTTGEAKKYLKYCNAEEIKGRKNRKKYLPGRDKWTLSETKQNALPRKPKYEGPYTFVDALDRADKIRESILYDEEENSSSDVNSEED